ncbi:MAG: hypothetical protein RL736_471 [Pseudomonadota bacterium]|jgi:hypothetical protein
MNNLNYKNPPSIHEMRKNNWKVRVIHGYINDLKKTLDSFYIISELATRYTRIEITCPKNLNSFGESFCSNKDQYNRKLGNRIALARAIKNYQKQYN